MAVDDPSCGMRWQVLAGIGKVESGHARGGSLTAAGDAVPRILGPVLNGVGAVVTGVVLLVVAATKAHEGAWIIILLIPVIVVFFLAQKAFVEGVTLTGVKG